MSMKRYQSWGRYLKAHHEVVKVNTRHRTLPLKEMGDKSFLPFGNGRSYGDVCLNNDGFLLDCQNLNHFICFDSDNGLIRCEAGVLLSEILKIAVPKGWFLPVTPGTKFVSVGGAIANDVHGKNHHKAGSFGCHVLGLELLRSDGARLYCSPEENEDFFKATISGLGLTGVITWAEIQLCKIESPYIDQEVIRFRTLNEFFALANESDQEYEHTVSWIDCTANGDTLGRGLFFRGNYSFDEGKVPCKPSPLGLKIPIDPPLPLINGLSLKLFNNLYYRKQWSDRVKNLVHYDPFFYPLDSIHEWNRIYGSKGFLQYQCVVPENNAKEAIQEILERISDSRTGSFLAVLKLFGDKKSPGLMSFPMPGATLALDFPYLGNRTEQLFDQLDSVTQQAGGRIYPAKDALMSQELFQAGYPDWQAMQKYIDPQISSSFWRRVTMPL